MRPVTRRAGRWDGRRRCWAREAAAGWWRVALALEQLLWGSTPSIASCNLVSTSCMRARRMRWVYWPETTWFAS